VPRRRLDVELVRRGLAGSQEEAHEAIRNGHVTVGGAPATKITTLVAGDEALAVAGPARPFVSRGGHKLVAALDAFAIDPTGRDCLDAGASTGGFTDCLLQRGASHVVALDVGTAQLAWELRTDPRVTILEKTDVRALGRLTLPYRPSLVTADLSFISLRSVVGPLIHAADPHADLVLLVKPQFEAGREQVEEGGVVRDPDVWRRVIEEVAAAVARGGAAAAGVIASPIRGPAGNAEFLLHAKAGLAKVGAKAGASVGIGVGPLDIDRAIGAAQEPATG
jgi:23S rRNA (cytidine1920-2'-O)/16S rRNA (cytidine1409-2'-O)-methyltransferase